MFIDNHIHIHLKAGNSSVLIFLNPLLFCLLSFPSIRCCDFPVSSSGWAKKYYNLSSISAIVFYNSYGFDGGNTFTESNICATKYVWENLSLDYTYVGLTYFFLWCFC